MPKKPLKNDFESTRDFYVELYRKLGYKEYKDKRYTAYKFRDLLRGLMLEEVLRLKGVLENRYLPKSDRRQVERSLISLLDVLTRTIEK